MAQRPRLGQIKRNGINYRTFEEQFEELEGNTSHFRNPVRTKGELPFDGNVDGTQCLGVEEGVVYYWDEEIQNWQATLGQVFKMDTATFKRWKKVYIATEGQVEFMTEVLFEPGRNELDVYIQGMLQDVDIDYTELNDHTIVFSEPVPAGAVVTLATPMIVESTSSIANYMKRIEALEFNSYQMMMTQYYDGKGFEAQGMVYDGFINTDYIDYVLTSPNVKYDAVRKSMYVYQTEESGITEQFDNNTKIDTAKTTLYMRGSEVTLPITAVYTDVFVDDFSTQSLMDLAESNVFWDREKQLITNDDTGGGGSHYYKGDFMSTTGNVDLAGFSEDQTRWVGSYYGDSSGSKVNLAAGANCYAVLAMGTMNAVINNVGFVYRNAWPYSSYGHMYANTAQYYRSDGVTYDSSVSTNYRYNSSYGIWPVKDGHARPTTVYVRQWNKIVALYQYTESSGRYYQRLMSANGRSASVHPWSWHNRPTGLPNTMFGSAVNTFTQSSSYISQVGSTYEHLLLRVGNIVYFLNSSMTVVKTLDWSKATRKPATYNVTSQQITADKRYLYFPARLLRDGYWGYYLEVFLIEDGSYVGEILVTRDNSGSPGTTAMGFDHDYNRLILGQQGSNKYTFYGKGKNVIQEQSAYAGMAIFEAPDEREREVVSRPMTTNLPIVYYRLNATQTLNAGTIDYYIRFNDEAWTKINLNTNYSWVNPNGAKETIIQMRAVLKTVYTAVKAPEITDWKLSVRPYETFGKYRSKQKMLSMNGVTGGSLRPTQDVPSETQMQWFVELDEEGNRYYAGKDGSFSIPLNTGDALFTVEGNMATSNNLLSPVVKDMRLQLYRNDEGQLVSETSHQVYDISEVNAWVTSSSGNSNYELDISRDGGNTWIAAEKRNSMQVTNGDIETNWYYDFRGTVNGERDFKMRFRINGATEILQYGAKIN